MRRATVFLTAILAFAGMTGFTPTTPTAAAAQSYAVQGWHQYGSYHCYADACYAANRLQHCGYCTKIVYDCGWYKVYYH